MRILIISAICVLGSPITAQDVPQLVTGCWQAQFEGPLPSWETNPERQFDRALIKVEANSPPKESYFAGASSAQTNSIGQVVFGLILETSISAVLLSECLDQPSMGPSAVECFPVINGTPDMDPDFGYVELDVSKVGAMQVVSYAMTGDAGVTLHDGGDFSDFPFEVSPVPEENCRALAQ